LNDGAQRGFNFFEVFRRRGHDEFSEREIEKGRV
jgi:hypothetical protein